MPGAHVVVSPATRLASLAGLVVLLAAWTALPALGQTPLTHTEDAAPIPRGMLRLRVTNAWTRYDERYGTGGLLSPLGSELSTDSLGPRQLPRLTNAELGLQALTRDPSVRLTLGRLAVRSDARIVTTPIALEYGVTSRLSIGLMVPVVQTRRTVQVGVNTDSLAAANAGYVPAVQRSAAATANALVATAYQRAADSLAALISRCSTTPSGSGCAPVVANPAAANAAQQDAQRFAAAVKSLGVDTASALVAPRAGSPLASRIDVERLALNARLQQYLGAGAGASTSIFFAATAFSYVDLQGRVGAPGLLQGPLGGGLDSIRTTERISVGDIELGAQLLVMDGFQHDSMPLRALQSRLSVGAAVRFATSRPDSSRNLVDIGTGDGAGFTLRSALDLIHGRAGGTIAAQYVKSLARDVQGALTGDPEAAFLGPVFGPVRRTAGDVLALDVTPRYLMSDTFGFDLRYGYERRGGATYDRAAASDPSSPAVGSGAITMPARTVQRLGVGMRYSTVDAYQRGEARYPIEVSFAHLGTASGDVGEPKASRDQIQVRLFFRLRRP